MSLEHSSSVWESAEPANTAQRLILLALADHADRESGECWPSLRRLAKMTCLSLRHVRRILRTLETGGFIRTRPGGWNRASNKSRPNLYTVLIRPTEVGEHSLGVRETLKSGGWGHISPGDTDNHVRGIRTPASAEPSVEPSVEPSIYNPLNPPVEQGEEACIKNSYSQAQPDSQAASVTSLATSRKPNSKRRKSTKPQDYPEPQQSRMIALGDIMHRLQNALWGHAEVRILRQTGLLDLDDVAFEHEREVIGRFYRASISEAVSPQFPRRTTLSNLLQNWEGELDKARRWARKHSPEADGVHFG